MVAAERTEYEATTAWSRPPVFSSSSVPGRAGKDRLWRKKTGWQEHIMSSREWGRKLTYETECVDSYGTSGAL